MDTESPLRVAEEQAAKDRELLAALAARPKAEPVMSEPIISIRHLNRAERRQQVAFYAKVLAESERQTPVVNATIIPRAKRRRQKQHRRTA